MRRTLVRLALLASGLVALPAAGDEVDCPWGAERRGAAPPEGYRQWCEDDEGRQHGPSVAWDRAGRRRVEAEFEHGAMDGDYRTWHPSGQLAEEGSYKDDVRHGTWTIWYEDGTRAKEQEFRGGEPDGRSREWYPNGQLRFDEHYEDGARHGPAVAFYANGQKQSEGAFERGEFHGTWTSWYEDGARRKVARFVHGTKTEERLFPREEDDAR